MIATIITSSADLLGIASIKGRARVVYYVFRDGMQRALTELQKLPNPCRAEE